MEMMKAAVLYGKQDIRIEERPVPQVGPGQMLVKIDYVGICGTDIEFFNMGETPTPLPKIMGHENSGTVCKIGEGVEGFQVGDRVLCGPPTHCKENCPACRTGATNICINGFPRTAGIGFPDGGYAEYFLVQDVAHTMIIKVPDNVDLKDAVLFDVICVALHALRKSAFRFGDTVVVAGMGPVGLSEVQFLKTGGADKIIALDVDDAKEAPARRYGADFFINTRTCKDVAGAIRAITGTDVGADVVFECSGNPRSVNTCVFDSVKPGGQVMLVGTVQEPTGLLFGRAQIFEPDLKLSFVYTEDEVQMYLSMLASGKIEFPGMVTDIIPLADCVSRGLARPDRASQLKILIKP